MRQSIDFKEMEQILDTSVHLDLTVNDLRILVTSLNAMVYFGRTNGERYLDSEGENLKERMENIYLELVDQKAPD